MSELAVTGRDTTMERLEIAARFAKMVAGTDFIPASFRKVDEHGRLDTEATAATVAAAVFAGREMGFEPMASLRAIVIIRGTPCLTALGLRAIAQAHGHSIMVMESTNTRAVVRARRLGFEPQDSVWDMDRVKQLAPQGFSDPKGPWQRQPKSMLVARATAEAARWVAADAIMAVPYAEYEMTDEGSEDAAVAPDPPAPQQRQRTAQRRTPRACPLPSAGPLPPPPAHHGGAGGDEAAGSAQGAQEPSEASGEPAPVSTPDPAAAPVNDSQRRRIMASLNELGVRDAATARELISDWIGRPIRSRNELSREEASTVIDILNHELEQASQRPEEAE